ncbi:hypothetical protein [Nostoc sp. GT001]|uniref:hypothetical protein n=1 Tax=Nostoc sp. GT001 TaxID=3056647 RepID=UPI0025AB3391|nr:hypothetical protein [Nostoc sp. GT001]MDM9583115.1 hypothetical protein [Nostoc sp. GT001]
MPQEIEIFAAGTHTSSNGTTVTLNESDLDAIASSYNPDLFDAPAVVGHPRDNSPAYAWVEGVRRVGSKLMASLKDWDTDFQEAVKNKRYKKISASFYSPDSSSNPKPGNYYLRHVGFLGGMAPAVKGLKSVAFGEVEEGVVDFCCGMSGDKEIFRNLREWLIEQYGMETSDRVVPGYLLTLPDDNRLNYLENRINELENFISKTFSPDMESRLEEVGEKVMQLLNKYDYTEEPVPSEESIELSEQVQELQNELRQAKLEKKREAIANFVEGLRGKIRPNQKPQLIEFMMALPEEEVEFADSGSGSDKGASGKPQTHLAWLQGFLKSQPDLVNLREVVRDEEIEEFSEEEKQSRSAYADAAKAYENAWK